MPQSGDGDLWPTTDDDTSSKKAKDAETHELPVPDQEKQPEKPNAKPAAGGWFDLPGEAPEAETPVADDEKRDEPHAKPEQQITQPVTWPVADLERQVEAAKKEKSEDPATVFSRPLPKSSDEATAFVKRPAKDTPTWPGAEAEKKKGEPAKQENPATSYARPIGDAPPSFLRPDRIDRANGTDRPGQPDRPTQPDRSDKADRSAQSERPGQADRSAQSDRPGQSERSAQPDDLAQPDRPGQPDGSGKSDRPGAERAGQPDRPGQPERPGQPGGPSQSERPGQGDRSGQSERPGSERAGQPDRPGLFDRPGQPNRPGQSDRAAQPGQPDRAENTDAATSFIRRDTFSRPDSNADQPTKFIRRDTAPSFTRPSTDNAPVTQQDRRADWPPPEPPRAAPQRVGPEPAESEKQPRSRKPLLVAAIAIVAVIGIAAGVVFGVPGLSDKLGLTGEEPVAIDPPPAPVTYSPALHGPDDATAAPTQQGVEQAISGPMADPALGNVNGIVIDPATGDTLYEKNAAGATTPASTGKILTAAAALLSLDPTEQLVTKVVEGDQPGEVIIVGGGDPTISSLEVGKESIYPGAAHLSQLVDQVTASGTQVDTVYIDQSRYTGPRLAESWLQADIGAGYIAPIVPAMLDGDRQGDPAENYVARTTDPGRTLVDAFAERIGASPADSIEKKAPENSKVLGEIKSAPMTQLVDNMLNRSENTLGDVLAHEVALEAGEEPSFDGASKAMLDVLRENGFDVEGVVLRDGSGMSEENKMTAKLLAEVLAVAASPDGKDPRTAKLRPLLGGLPVAGGSGTLADRYTEADAVAGKGWVRAKTGSLTGINSLAGIVLDKDNRPLVFAFLTSGSVATSARPALDSVTAALRGCGCQ